MPRYISPATRYVSVDQASEITQLSNRTLRRAIKAKRLGAYHAGHLLRIDVLELQRWVEADGAPPPVTLDHTDLNT